MPTSPQDEPALTAVLAEYEALRSEMAWLIDHSAQLQNYAIGLSLGVFPVATFVLQNSSAVFLIGLFLALPVALSLLGLLYFRQHQEVYVVAAYIREEIRPIIRKLTGHDALWGWEEFKDARQARLSERSPILGVWRPRTILLLRLAIFSLPAICSLLIAISLAIAQGIDSIHASYTTAGSAVLLLFAVIDVLIMVVLGIRFWKESDLRRVVMDTGSSAEPPAAVEADSVVRVVVVSSFPPRLCGIATFASHLNAALAALDVHIEPLVVVNGQGAEQEGTIRRDIDTDYEKEAKRLNDLQPDLVLIQHEYGLFGGLYGSHLLTLACCLQVPIATVFHTVLPSPDNALRKVTTQLASLSRVVMVMCSSAAKLLEQEYAVHDTPVTVVRHGYPELCKQPKPRRMKNADGGRGPTLLSVGLLGPNKGIEGGISAMADVLQHFPHARYFVVGSTHPSEIRHGVDGHRASLVAQAHENGVGNAVVFVDGYLTLEEHVAWIQHTDLVLIPHRDLRQVSSGTLAYSVGSGRAVVCTPFAYALELANAQAGLVLSPPTASGIASTIVRVLSNPWLHAHLMDQSATVAREMSWPRIAERYLEAFARL